VLEELRREAAFQTSHRLERDLWELEPLVQVVLELVQQRAMAMAQLGTLAEAQRLRVPRPLAPREPAQEQLAKPSERQKVLAQQEQEASCYPMV